MRVRPIELPADADVLTRLAAQLAPESGLATLSEAKVMSLTNGTGGGFLLEEHGGVAAFVSIVVMAESGGWAIEVVTASPERHLAPLLEATIAASAEAGVRSIRWWVYGDEAWRAPRGFGFQPERALLFMVRDLPADDVPHFPPGVELAAFVPRRDDDLWLAANNAAFAGHPENGAWSRADLAVRFDADWFSAEGFRMAWAGGAENRDLAGFCWTKIHPTGEGEIYVIAVAPGHQGHGLGRQLVLEGMRHLAEQGCSQVVLYTESDNERGVALYVSLGFTTQTTHRALIRHA